LCVSQSSMGSFDAFATPRGEERPLFAHCGSPLTPALAKSRTGIPVGSGNSTQIFAFALDHVSLRSMARRGGGGGRRTVRAFCRGEHHHDRHRSDPKRIGRRLPLLAAVHACGLRATPLRRHDGGSRRVSQRCRPRRTCCGVRRGRGHARRRPSRVCSRQIARPTSRSPSYSRRRPPSPATTQRSPLPTSACLRRVGGKSLQSSVRLSSVEPRSFVWRRGSPARCRTRCGGGARPVAGNGRDQTRVKQPIRRIGLEWGSASSAVRAIEKAARPSKRAGHFSPSARRQSKSNGGDHRCAVF